jgi:DNA polymerase-3 subunit alpha
MRVWLERTEAVPHIRAILGREQGGRGRVVLVPCVGGPPVEIKLPGGFNVTPRLVQALKVVPGVQRVEEV